MLSGSESEILLDQIAANLQKLQWAAAAMNQPELSYLIEVALSKALEQLYAYSPGTQSSPLAAALPVAGGSAEKAATNPGSRSREALLRRIAQRRGYKLLKSRRRDPLARDYEKFLLLNVTTNTIVCGGRPYRFSSDIAEIEQFLGLA